MLPQLLTPALPGAVGQRLRICRGPEPAQAHQADAVLASGGGVLGLSASPLEILASIFLSVGAWDDDT